MEHKLKAIVNNVNNDSMNGLNDHELKRMDGPVCDKNVPVIFSTNRGVYLRKLSRQELSGYRTSFCDLQKWVSFLGF